MSTLHLLDASHPHCFSRCVSHTRPFVTRAHFVFPPICLPAHLSSRPFVFPPILSSRPFCLPAHFVFPPILYSRPFCLPAHFVFQFDTQERKCHAPLSTMSVNMYRHRSAECVEIVRLHCRSPTMSSLDTPRSGAEHCAEYHSKILLKKPPIELVQGLE